MRSSSDLAALPKEVAYLVFAAMNCRHTADAEPSPSGRVSLAEGQRSPPLMYTLRMVGVGIGSGQDAQLDRPAVARLTNMAFRDLARGFDSPGAEVAKAYMCSNAPHAVPTQRKCQAGTEFPT